MSGKRSRSYNYKQRRRKCEIWRRIRKDVLEIITVFSARLYGSRSKKNKKLLDGMQKVVVSNVNE